MKFYTKTYITSSRYALLITYHILKRFARILFALSRRRNIRYPANVFKETRSQEIARLGCLMVSDVLSFSILTRSFPLYILSFRTMRRFSFQLTVLIPVQSLIWNTMRIRFHRFSTSLPLSLSFIKSDSRKKNTSSYWRRRGSPKDYAREMFLMNAKRVGKNRREFGKTLYRWLTVSLIRPARRQALFASVSFTFVFSVLSPISCAF